jgi:hypothetical protein
MGQLEDPRRFSVVSNYNIENYVQLNRSKNKDHLAAFLALHETGHNAGIEHTTPSGSPCNGYMSSGDILSIGYFRTSIYDNLCCCLKGGANLTPTPEQLILFSFDPNMHHADISNIKERIYDRFIR